MLNRNYAKINMFVVILKNVKTKNGKNNLKV